MRKVAICTLILIGMTSCVQQEPRQVISADAVPEYRKQIFHLEAPCTVNVEGIGVVDIEEEYLPGVVSCENPNSPPEGLKAQAVMARTFLYYKLFIEGVTSIRNSQADQVFRCDHAPNGPTAAHIAAVEQTRGEYLEWNDHIIASFYVAGSIPPNPDANDPFNSCEGNGGNDPTNTERWVTYNKGRVNCDVEMTNLGFTTDDCFAFPDNRGCASQNGQTCLANVGVTYDEMFPMYYGEDVVLEVATGACGGNPPTNNNNNNNMNGNNAIDEFNAFCEDAADGFQCFNAVTRIQCEGGLSQQTEDCLNGCDQGSCIVQVEQSFCTGKEDDAYCDQSTRVECFDQNVTVSAICDQGCTEGSCNGTVVTPNEKDEDGGRVEQEGSLITTSTGVEGGCATATANSSWIFALLLVFGWRRRR